MGTMQEIKVIVMSHHYNVQASISRLILLNSLLSCPNLLFSILFFWSESQQGPTAAGCITAIRQ